MMGCAVSSNSIETYFQARVIYLTRIGQLERMMCGEWR